MQKYGRSRIKLHCNFRGICTAQNCRTHKFVLYHAVFASSSTEVKNRAIYESRYREKWIHRRKKTYRTIDIVRFHSICSLLRNHSRIKLCNASMQISEKTMRFRMVLPYVCIDGLEWVCDNCTFLRIAFSPEMGLYI